MPEIIAACGYRQRFDAHSRPQAEKATGVVVANQPTPDEQERGRISALPLSVAPGNLKHHG